MFLMVDAGHMHLFQKGYLHQDVSIGNVLVQFEREERSREMQERNDQVLTSQRLAYNIGVQTVLIWLLPGLCFFNDV